MTLRERINTLQYICESLQDTSSLNAKKQIVDDIDECLREDFDYILEILAGQHKLGYTYNVQESVLLMPFEYTNKTFKEYLQPLFMPLKEADLSYTNIVKWTRKCQWATAFVASIVNRTLRLGIGKSLLEKSEVSPMLAKKYEGQNIAGDIFITEKLDGNRCIAQFVDNKWVFTSRNGKEMYVDFDMEGFDRTLIYDGEVMSVQQTMNSIRRESKMNFTDNQMFNETSGLINRHTTKKDLVYNIFDITNADVQYKTRREYLSQCDNTSNVRILPVLSTDKSELDTLLDYIVGTGGEGLMINTADGMYQQKRTNDLLKYKQVQTMDMRVVDWEYGKGKYEYCLGYLVCEGTLKGNKISCKVGTGISDEQREEWGNHPERILGEIVEVAYFSVSQNATTIGTKVYSLRFPRLKKVRKDKSETSEY